VKRNPDQPYGSWGIGSTGHIAMEWIAVKKGLQIRHVPYKSIPQILSDLRGGVIDIAFLDARFSAIPMVRSGSLAPIAVTGTTRSTAFPDVPTLTEQGLTMNADGWYGIFAAAAVPEAIIDRINREVTGILTRPETLESLRQQHIVSPPLKSPKQFAETIHEDIQIWKELVQAAQLGA
jgi:tripartite-type tricarboxylate transporter receptor subunit TctC